MGEVGGMITAVVTTFSPKGYEVYGKRFIESFRKYWPDKVPLYIFYEGEKQPGWDGPSPGTWVPLDNDKDRAAFMARHTDKSDLDYRFRAVMYSHKVWAMTAPQVRGLADHLLWLDADSETFAPVTDKHIEDITALPGQIGSYLGRPFYKHTETGFLSFALKNGGDRFLDEMRRMYVMDEVYSLPEWHDCMVFDTVRKRFERQGYRFRNICPEARTLSVFEQSPLKDFIRHNKGPDRKEREYGHHMVPGHEGPLSEIIQRGAA